MNKAIKMKESGIDIKLRFSSITGHTQHQMIAVDEVESDDGRMYYPMNKFIERFGRSDKTIRRKMKKLNGGTKHYSVIRIGNKLFFNKSLYEEDPSWRTSGREADSEVNGGLRVGVDLRRLAQFNQDEFTPTTGATIDNGLIYYEVDEFEKRFKVSASSIYDYIERVYRERYRYCLSIGGKHYVSPGILFFSKRFLPQLKNLEYASFLNCYTWTVAGTIRYHNSDYHSADRCVRIMNKLGSHLKKNYPGDLHTFFFVTEKNNGPGGYHSHFVYGIQNDDLSMYTLTKRIEWFIAKHHGKYESQTLVEKIDQKDFFIEYMVKQMHKNPDHYGWSDHNLLV